MDRRRFLKLSGAGALGVWLSPTSVFGRHERAPVASVGKRQFRADRRGRIYVSRDEGRSWHLHTNLGPEYWVRRLASDRSGRVTARVGYRGREFRLVLDGDERSWRTG